MSLNQLKLTTHLGGTRIIELGSWIPDEIVCSKRLQADIDTIPGLRQFNIEKSVGVKERRISPEHITILDMAEYASRDAIARSLEIFDFDVNDIDTIIYCGVFRMYTEPSTASLLQNRLGIHSSISFDVSDACLGFANGLILADSFIKSGRSKLALIVSAEKAASKTLKNSHKAIMNGEGGAECLASLTLGDGATAALVCSEDIRCNASLSLKAFSRTTLGMYSDACILPSDDSPMSTDSRALFKGALNHYPQMLNDLLSDIQWDLKDVDIIIPHQASLKIIARGMELINYPINKCAITLDKYGNMASVSIPYTLKKVLHEGTVKAGDRIILLGFGSGLSFSMMALEVMENGSAFNCLNTA